MATISNLATSKYLTDKHWEARSTSAIKYIIPHHMAGKLSGAGCANYFVNNGLENSANYCIGYDGDISCNVPEEYGAWTSSFSLADKYAITVEISDTANGDWTIPGAAQEAFINLCVDLFKRYPSLGGKAIYDTSDASTVANAKKNYTSFTTKGNILLHQWTSNYGTTCPEWHMKQILPSLVAEINKRLSGQTTTTTTTTTTTATTSKSTFDVAQDVIDGKYGNGQTRIDGLTKAGYVYDTVKNQVDLMLAKSGFGLGKSDVYKLLPDITSGSSDTTAIKIAQTWLKKAGYYTGDVDGSFGNMTLTAVKAFQTNLKKIYGFTVDGIVGQKTWEKIFA